MEITRSVSSDHEEGDDTMLRLYEASVEGSVESLNSLIQNDPLLLSRISLTTFSETPLHVSALLGHLPLAERLLSLRPALASQLDARRRSPLHLASANGHAEIVRALLLLRDDGGDGVIMCLGRDEDGRIPLHYAAARGHVGAIERLVGALPSSVFERLPDGATVLHLCVQYNHLEALKVLVESAGCDNAQFLNCKDNAGGNTILDLAAMLKQIETVKYLLSIPGIRQDMNSNNNKGYKALDLLDHSQRDFKTFKLKTIIAENSVNTDDSLAGRDQQVSQYCRPPFYQLMAGLVTKLKAEAKVWLRSDQMRGSIMVVATLIAQMTFQAAINPPGGFWQQSTTKDQKAKCREGHPCIAGTAVLADVWAPDFLRFTKYNSIAFLSSLYVILVVAGGLPLNNGFCMWLMIVAMLFTLTFTARAFLEGLYLVTPLVILDPVHKIYEVSFWIWVALLSLVGLIHTIFILIWLKKSLPRTQLWLSLAAGCKSRSSSTATRA